MSKWLLALILAAGFLYAQAPSPVRLNPTSPSPGTILIITGTDFGSSGTVSIGKKVASIVSWQPNSVQVLVPAVFGETFYQICNTQGCSPANNILIASAFTPSGAAADRDNGIVISGVLQYSDATLQMLLDNARNKLATLQLIDQSAIMARVGTLQGGSYNTSSFGLSLNGPSVPGVTSTANTGNTVNTQQSQLSQQANTGNTVTTQSATPQVVVTSPSTISNSTNSNQAVSTGPSVQTVTTQAPANPTAPPLPATSSSFTLPSGFQPSASDVLNEQLQLTSQISGYQLLLEGSLTDRFMQFPFNGEVVTIPRTRITLGVPVDIRNAGKYPNAVAEVILTVTPSATAVSQEPPAIITLLPTEKTYNVASIVDKTVGIGGAVTTAVASVGVSWLWGHKTFYVVKDQDTLAFQVPTDATHPTSRSFGWQFRPTLGQVHVTEGPRQVYVQLGLPFGALTLPSIYQLGTVTVSTVWKKYHRNKGAVDDRPIEGSQSTYTTPFEILHYDLAPKFVNLNFTDNGDGNVVLGLTGTFLPRTALRVGSHVYVEGNPAVLVTPSSMQVTMPASDALATDLRIVDPSGSFSPVVKNDTINFAGQQCFTAGPATVHQISATTTRVNLPVTIATTGICASALRTDDLVAVIGNRVFGLRDAPFIDRQPNSLSLLLPTDFLRANREIILKRPLWGSAFERLVSVDVSSTLTSVTQTAVVEQSPATTKIALLGTGLGRLVKVSPSSVNIDSSDSFYAIISVPTQDIQGIKQIVLKDNSGSLLLVSVPAAGDGPTIDKAQPFRSGGSSLHLTGSGLDQVISISWNNAPVTIISKDKNSITLGASALLARAGSQTLKFKFPKGAPVPYTITVVDQIESQITSTP